MSSPWDTTSSSESADSLDDDLEMAGSGGSSGYAALNGHHGEKRSYYDTSAGRIRHQLGQHPRLLGGVGASALLVCFLLMYSRTPTPFQYSVDPFSQPGYLSYDSKDPLAANWIPYTLPGEAVVPAAPDWLDIVRTAADLRNPETKKLPNEGSRHRQSKQKEALVQLSHLQKTSILLIGDSVDRNNIVYLADNLDSHFEFEADQYSDITRDDFWNFKEWDVRTIPHWFHLRPEKNNGVELHINNCFMYGLDDVEEFGVQPDWHGPGKAEDRIDELCKPYVDQMPHPPSMIMLHSGMWDLAFFGRRDVKNPNKALHDTDKPLRKEQLEWWISRMTQVIHKVQATWPGLPIIYRTLHRVTSPESTWDWAPDAHDRKNFTNFFTDIRVAQIQEMQRYVAKKEGLQIFDWGRIWEGYQGYQDKVHPLNYPGGVVAGKAILNYAYMASMEKESRQNKQR